MLYISLPFLSLLPAVCASTLMRRIRSLTSRVLSLRYAQCRQFVKAIAQVVCRCYAVCNMLYTISSAACHCLAVPALQTTQQKVQEAVKEQQDTVRNILDLAPVPQDEEECRWPSALLTAAAHSAVSVCTVLQPLVTLSFNDSNVMCTIGFLSSCQSESARFFAVGAAVCVVS